MKFKYFYWLLASCLILNGCSRPKNDSKNVHNHLSRLNIWGGEKVGLQDPLAGTAVAITKANGFPFCTGVYLGGQIVVTAAHCLTEIQAPLAYISFDLETPTEWDPTYGNLGPNSPNTRKIRAFITHESFDAGRFSTANLLKEPNTPLFDLGILIFDGIAPVGAKAAALMSTDQLIGPETELMLAGYGRSDARGGDYGRLYKVLTKVGQLRSVSLEIVDGPNSEKGSCVGDSGGPVMAKSEIPKSTPNSPGVESFSLSGLVSYGPSDCGIGKGFNTDLRYFTEWVESRRKCIENAVWLGSDTSALKAKCGQSAAVMKDYVPVAKGSFYESCLHRTQGTSFDHTMQVLLGKLGTTDCLVAAKLSTQIKNLDLSHEEIVNIEPLEHFVYLEELDISYNQISEAKALASLQNLKKIHLFQSGIDNGQTASAPRPFSHLRDLANGQFLKARMSDESFQSNKLSQWLWLSAISPHLSFLGGFDLDDVPVLSAVGNDGLRKLH
jgi:hypothetical protein